MCEQRDLEYSLRKVCQGINGRSISRLSSSNENPHGVGQTSFAVGHGTHSGMTFSGNTILTKFSMVQEMDGGCTEGRMVVKGENWYGRNRGLINEKWSFSFCQRQAVSSPHNLVLHISPIFLTHKKVNYKIYVLF